MSWNAGLYYYHLSRGGEYFGLPQKDEAHAALTLPRDKGPIHLQPWLGSYGRYGVSWNITAACRIELQAPYTLKITGGGTVRRGWNTVLEGLDQGYKLLGGKGDLHPDFGAPELAAQRGLKSDNAPFTRWVLQSNELRKALEASEKASVCVEPLVPGSRQHLVCAHMDYEEFPIPPGLDPWDLEEQKPRDFEDSEFFHKLDTLVELLEIARDAVTAWPMPQTMESPK